MSFNKALLVGINAYQDAPLRGCVNDVLQMKDLLQAYYGFPKEGIRMITDQEATSEAIKAGLEWLAQNGESDAVRVFHFSGHGTHVADQNGDEPDGRDECLVPYDYRTAGVLTDDTLKTLYDRFPRTGNLTLVMDCCYSGAIQRAAESDTIYRFFPVPAAEQARIDAATARFVTDQREFVVNKLLELRNREQLSEDELRDKVSQLMKTFEKKRFGDIRVREANVLLAGCRADQQAADAPFDGNYYGAFTYFLAEAIKQSNGQITYRQLVEQVGGKLGSAGFVQIPQLEYYADRDERPVFRSFSQ
jgi:hypothetical protein